jgi:hypothetical protein
MRVGMALAHGKEFANNINVCMGPSQRALASSKAASYVETFSSAIVMPVPQLAATFASSTLEAALVGDMELTNGIAFGAFASAIIP